MEGSYKITTMPEFVKTASGIYTLGEIQSLRERLEKDPWQGTIVYKSSPILRTINHPEYGNSIRGFTPMCLFIINEPDREIVLVHVHSTEKAWRQSFRDPSNWIKFGILADRIYELVQRLIKDLD
jgi:hypothetical protein